MEKTSTKQAILKAALDLFSVQGFEGTSVSQIADAVGIRKASLYSHFESKQALLDALLQKTLKGYREHSVFATTDWNDSEFTDKIKHITAEKASQMVREHIRYILHDPHISKGRKMLVIEQFRNPELSTLFTAQNYTAVMQYFSKMTELLIREGVFKEGDPEIMAAQLCLPISAWISLCDRHPSLEPQVMETVDRHIRQFFEIYGKQ